MRYKKHIFNKNHFFNNYYIRFIGKYLFHRNVNIVQLNDMTQILIYLKVYFDNKNSE